MSYYPSLINTVSLQNFLENPLHPQQVHDETIYLNRQVIEIHLRNPSQVNLELIANVNSIQIMNFQIGSSVLPYQQFTGGLKLTILFR